MDKLADLFENFATKYGPATVETALQTVRVETYSNMVASGLWLAFAPLSIGVGFFIYHCCDNPTKREDVELRPFAQGCGGLILLLAGVMVVCQLWFFIDPWTWTAINHPEVYIAHKLMKL